MGKKVVTGLRLCLEGKKNNCLAIQLQYLSSLPKAFQLEDDPNPNGWYIPNTQLESRYYEKFGLRSFSHVCTAPVESDEGLSIVTGAHFEAGVGQKKVLFLRLHFAKVTGAICVKCPEWDGSPYLTQKSGLISTLGTRFSSAEKPPPRPSDVNINSGLFPEAEGPPVPMLKPKLLRFVDTTEMIRGPQHRPGFWAVSGARLVLENRKISLRVKYSLLTVIPPDQE